MANKKWIKTVCTFTSLLALAGCEQTSSSNDVRVDTKAALNSAKPTQQSNINSNNSAKYPQHVLWGDQHIHSAWSADAGLANATLTPEDAVRFARGESVKYHTGEIVKLNRKLDWVAVTDHSDGMGTFNEMMSGNEEFMNDATAKRWSEMMAQGIEESMAAKKEVVSAQANRKLPKVFMDPKWMVSAWEKNVDIMEQYNEPGEFTAFIAYEWTSNGEDGNNLHRNVIFRDGADKTRPFPPLTTFVSSTPSVSGSDPESLWHWLENWENKTGGQVLAIPHNGNMSNGQMFERTRYNGEPLTKVWVEDRARWEVLYEIFQYKGQSESHPSLSPNDEYADFGIWDTANLDGKVKQPGQINTEYAREALKMGLALQSQFGTNPFKIGLVAGTDTHNGLSTGENEDNFYSKFGYSYPRAGRWNDIYKQEGDYTRRDWTILAAGITGVWATENTREAIWDAMKRREVYASSGPRISIRFFGGFDLTAADANSDRLVEAGYTKGVPMGGDLYAAPENKVPTFTFSALKDPLKANLDSMQIIKGWVDNKGELHEKIYNVAWSQRDKRKEIDGKLTKVGNTVDLTNATYTNSIGATEFIGSFTDPDFDPLQPAFYYARVIEIPTPRWVAFDAVKFKETIPKDVKMIQQERVVTSPIWYNPSSNPKQ